MTMSEYQDDLIRERDELIEHIENIHKESNKYILPHNIYPKIAGIDKKFPGAAVEKQNIKDKE